GKDICRQVFRTDHWWDGHRNCVELAVAGDRHRRFDLALSDAREGAQGSHVAHPKLSPIRQCWRQSSPDFAGAEPQQSVPGASCKRLLQPQALLGLQSRCFPGFPEGQQAMGGENGFLRHCEGASLQSRRCTRLWLQAARLIEKRLRWPVGRENSKKHKSIY